MNKNSTKKANSKKVNLSTIEEKVDKIISKNKEKLDKLESKEIDIEKFSLKNKGKNTVFYLRKKHRTKTVDTIDSNKTKDNKIENFNKSKKEFFKDPTAPQTLKDLIESKNFDEVVNDIKKTIDEIFKTQGNISKKLIEKSIIKSIQKSPNILCLGYEKFKAHVIKFLNK